MAEPGADEVGIEILRLEDFPARQVAEREEKEPVRSEDRVELQELHGDGSETEYVAQGIGTQGSGFIPRTIQNHLDMASYGSYDALVKNFYTIDGGTMAGSDLLNTEKLTSYNCTMQKSDAPQILIYHTHSREAFVDSVPGDESTTIVGMGALLADKLCNEYGYHVVHCKEAFDADGRNDAYTNALPLVSRILEKYPSIEMVIDLHRDEMPEGTRLVTEVDGIPMARFMLFNGISRTRQTGKISYLENPNLDANLSFSFQVQRKAMEYYPGLTRKIYLKGYRYNMHLKEKYLLIELGAQNNTVAEVQNTCGPIAHILDMVLTGQ
ncbi:MAG: stage II sporulation protein P [Lachnospiraceae bacterium]|nr:stage II sporulation protein P [Lachnospiraceae bacterium]